MKKTKLVTVSLCVAIVVAVLFTALVRIKPVQGTVTTLASTELLNFYSMTDSEKDTFLEDIDAQNITHFTLRGMAMYEWDDTSWTTIDSRIAEAEIFITKANALGIDVSYDLHTWYTTWDSYFRQTASGRDANRVTYINYVKHVLTAFTEDGANVHSFMVLNEPQGRIAVSGENQFILDIISNASTVTTKPLSVRFMGGWSPTAANTGYVYSDHAYDPAIDTASDFLCRNTYWKSTNPTVEVYQCSEQDLINVRDVAHAASKEFWITETGWGKPDADSWTSAHLESQRVHVESMVGWCNDHDIDAAYFWASQPEAGSGENYNLYSGYTPHSSFYELTNQAAGTTPSNSVMLNQPNNLETLDHFTIKFNYTASFGLGSIKNSSLWVNVSSTWQRLSWNTTKITNGTMHTISYTFSVNTTYKWNIRVFNSTSIATWGSANRTFTIETTSPPDDPPTYGSHSVSTTIAGANATFQCVWDDDNSLSFGWLCTNSSGTWANRTIVPMFTPHLTFNDIMTLTSSVSIVVGYRFYANDTISQETGTPIYTLVTIAASAEIPYDYGSWW